MPLTALQELESGPSAEDTAKLQAAVDIAEASLTSAQLDMDLASKEWEDEIASASEAVDDAVDGYRGVFRKWLGIEVTDDQVGSDPAALLEFLGLDLDVIFARRPAPYTVGLPPDDPATAWSEPLVRIWLNFYPGRVVTTCSVDALPAGSLCIGREMDDAWEALSAALDALETAEANAAGALVKAEADVDRATGDLTKAQDDLADFTEPPDSLDLETAPSPGGVDSGVAGIGATRPRPARGAPGRGRRGPQGEGGCRCQSRASAGKGRSCRAEAACPAGRGGCTERSCVGGGGVGRCRVAFGGYGDACPARRGSRTEQGSVGGGGVGRCRVAFGGYGDACPARRGSRTEQGSVG